MTRVVARRGLTSRAATLQKPSHEASVGRAYNHLALLVAGCLCVLSVASSVASAQTPFVAATYDYDESARNVQLAPTSAPLVRMPDGSWMLANKSRESGDARFAFANLLAAKGGAQALGPRFAPGKWLTHFEKHGAEFGYKNSMEYLKGARALVGRQGVQTHTRANGDRLFYDAATNEFAVMRPDGVLRTYFRPETGSAYWKGQTGR